MVVHRGSSWDSSPDTSHRPTLLTINQNALVTFDGDAAPLYKHNGLQSLSLPDSGDQETMVEWVSLFKHSFRIIITKS